MLMDLNNNSDRDLKMGNNYQRANLDNLVIRIEDFVASIVPKTYQLNYLIFYYSYIKSLQIAQTCG